MAHREVSVEDIESDSPDLNMESMRDQVIKEALEALIEVEASMRLQAAEAKAIDAQSGQREMTDTPSEPTTDDQPSSRAQAIGDTTSTKGNLQAPSTTPKKTSAAGEVDVSTAPVESLQEPSPAPPPTPPADVPSPSKLQPTEAQSSHTEDLPAAPTNPTPPSSAGQPETAGWSDVLYDAWETINQTLQFRSSDAQYWWDTTGRTYAKLLHYAGYTPAEQYRELMFYALFVAPELGRAPDAAGKPQGWRSSNTWDGSPVDFSWDWGNDGGRATVRYTIELIGKGAGTAANPLNEHATDNWISRMREQNMISSLDMQWYNHFCAAVLPGKDMECRKTFDHRPEETTPMAGIFVGIDIEKSGPALKMYMYPGLRAMELGISSLAVVQRAIRTIPREQQEALNAKPVLDWLDEAAVKYKCEIGVLGIDCLVPEHARVKIYGRAPDTSHEYLVDVLTMGGRLPLDQGADAIADLEDFWKTFLAETPSEVPNDAPARANPGFYYTLGYGQAPSPKIYLLASFSCKSDVDVLDRLRTFFSTRRTDGMIDQYEKAIEDIL